MANREGAESPAPRSTATRRADGGPITGPSRSMEWVRFGGLLMAVVGPFSLIEGVLALTVPDTYIAAEGRVLAIGLAGWAWVHIVFGVLVFLTGLALLRDEVSDRARVLGITVVVLSMIVQLAWLPAAPVWAVIMIVLDLLVLRALVVTSGDFGVGQR